MRLGFAGGFAAVCLAGIAGCRDAGTSPGPEVAAALQWVDRSSFALAAVEPAASTGDLTAFRTMAGSARLIALGEATHGSREFFTMKDRLFRYLVEEAGVTGFAIEASMPEAFAIDTYVRTGVGNPAVLLSSLYYWTWNTQEVADLISALRAWNQAHPEKQVGFYGFDMQYPGMAIDSVKSFIARVAPGMSAAVADGYACLANYRNNSRGSFPQRYAAASASTWNVCAPKVADVYAHLDASRADLAGGSSQREFDLALQMARVVVQWEYMSRNAGASRDAAMAENVGWLLDREGPGGKLFLWAHNYHVSRTANSMGFALATAYGQDYLPVGFAFAGGGLNAVEGLPAGKFAGLKSFVAPAPTTGSYEATFQQSTAANFILDLRSTPTATAAATWLNGPRPIRTVGSVYFPQNPDSHYTTLSLRDAFDVLIFIRTTTPSTRLPFQF